MSILVKFAKIFDNWPNGEMHEEMHGPTGKGGDVKGIYENCETFSGIEFVLAWVPNETRIVPNWELAIDSFHG
jgi:hypothetical protein